MGRKGVSKRKPKKKAQYSNAGISNYGEAKNSGHSPVQSIVNDKGAPLTRDSANPKGGSSKPPKKKKR